MIACSLVHEGVAGTSLSRIQVSRAVLAQLPLRHPDIGVPPVPRAYVRQKLSRRRLSCELRQRQHKND